MPLHVLKPVMMGLEGLHSKQGNVYANVQGIPGDSENTFSLLFSDSCKVKVITVPLYYCTLIITFNCHRGKFSSLSTI